MSACACLMWLKVWFVVNCCLLLFLKSSTPARNVMLTDFGAALMSGDGWVGKRKRRGSPAQSKRQKVATSTVVKPDVSPCGGGTATSAPSAPSVPADVKPDGALSSAVAPAEVNAPTAVKADGLSAVTSGKRTGDSSTELLSAPAAAKPGGSPLSVGMSASSVLVNAPTAVKTGDFSSAVTSRTGHSSSAAGKPYALNGSTTLPLPTSTVATLPQATSGSVCEEAPAEWWLEDSQWWHSLEHNS